MKLISIVMPVLNKEKLVGEAISSAIAQDYDEIRDMAITI